jgi:hypothetical protein
MNNRKFIGIIVVAAIGVFTFIRLIAAEPKISPGTFEYATIRWAGKDNTHVIRPGGQVEFIGHELKRANRPERADDRAFFMNLAMNGLVKEGYEFAGMNTDEIVMKRPVGK